MKEHSITFALSTLNANVINATKTSMTWNDIRLQTLLGSLYDEYDFFDIQLNSTICLSGSATDANNNLIIYLQGLPFIGLGLVGKMPIGLTKAGNATTGALNQMSSIPKNTFFKPNSTTSLTISLNAVSTNVLSTETFGHSVYLFTVTGIKK